MNRMNNYKFLDVATRIVVTITLLLFFLAVLNCNSLYVYAMNAVTVTDNNSSNEAQNVNTTESVAVDNANTTETAVTDTGILTSPMNVKTVKEKKYVKLSWDKVEGAYKYHIYRKATTSEDDSDEEFELTGDTKKLSYKDKDVEAGNRYEYYVTAVSEDEAKVSTPSEVAYYFMEPQSFEVASSFTDKNKIKLTWKEVPAARKYVIYRKNTSGKYIKLSETSKKKYLDDSVRKGKTYKYKVSYIVNLSNGNVIEKESKVHTVTANTIDPNKKMVALTFDDGPGRYTQEIVDCLKKNDARATFFVVGSNLNSYKSAVKNAYKIGCEIGNHSYNHANLAQLSAQGVAKQMSDTDARIKKITGSNSVIMRCPYGSTSKTVSSAVGKPIILWSVDTLDWKTRNTDKTISCVMNKVKDGDIVLMHDIHEPTKRAALYLIPQLKKKGYQLVTVSELAKYRGYKLNKGSVYHSLRKKK